MRAILYIRPAAYTLALDTQSGPTRYNFKGGRAGQLLPAPFGQERGKEQCIERLHLHETWINGKLSAAARLPSYLRVHGHNRVAYISHVLERVSTANTSNPVVNWRIRNDISQ